MNESRPEVGMENPLLFDYCRYVADSFLGLKPEVLSQVARKLMTVHVKRAQHSGISLDQMLDKLNTDKTLKETITTGIRIANSGWNTLRGSPPPYDAMSAEFSDGIQYISEDIAQMVEKMR